MANVTLKANFDNNRSQASTKEPADNNFAGGSSIENQLNSQQAVDNYNSKSGFLLPAAEDECEKVQNEAYKVIFQLF